MKISNNQVESILKLYVQGVLSEKKREKAGLKRKEGDTVTFSSQVDEVKDLYARYRNLPEVRENLVKEIQERLRQGEYRVSGEEVARKMLQREAVDFLMNREEGL